MFSTDMKFRRLSLTVIACQSWTESMQIQVSKDVLSSIFCRISEIILAEALSMWHDGDPSDVFHIIRCAAPNERLSDCHSYVWNSCSSSLATTLCLFYFTEDPKSFSLHTDVCGTDQK